MRTTLVLKNGYRFRDTILDENSEELVLNDCKLGRTIVNKSSIAARSDEVAGNE